MPRSLVGFIKGHHCRIVAHKAQDLRDSISEHLGNRYPELSLMLWELEQDMYDEANAIQNSYPDDPEPDPKLPDL